MIYELGEVSARPTPSPVAPDTVNPGTVLLGIGLVLGALWLIDRVSPEPSRRRTLRQADKDYVSQRDGWRCTYCNRRVNRRSRHIDHSVSVANGGTDHLNNLRLACAPCNLLKGSLNARDFRRSA